jgi:outer membrane protein assembly factor BamB
MGKHGNGRGGVTVAVVVSAFLALAHGGELPEWIGYRGPGGSSVFRDARPPLKWDARTGENIRWRVPVANWGHSSPVAVNGRVFVVSEAGWKHAFPVIECFDAENGRKRWEVELDHLDAVDAVAAERVAARKAWAELVEWFCDANEACLLWNSGVFEEQRKAARVIERLKSKAPADPDAAKAEWTDVGEESPPVLKQKISLGLLKSNAAADSICRRNPEFLKKFGWSWESWYHAGGGIGCIGHAFGTPLSDGDRIYVTTGFDACFCLDMDGKVLWRAAVKGLDSGDFCKCARSPILYRGADAKGPAIVISDVNQLVRAFDPFTGRLLWKRELVRGYTSMATPVTARVGDRDVLLCSGLDFPSAPMQLHAFVMPDGTEVKVDGWTSPGGTMTIKTDERDVVFFTGGGEHGGWEGKGNHKYPPPAAVRFGFEGEVLKASVLWSGVEGGAHGGHAGVAYDKGKLYANGLVLDAATGKRLAGQVRPGGKAKDGSGAPAAPGGHLALVANGHIYGMRSVGASEAACEVFTLDGVKVAGSVLPLAEVEGAKREQILRNTGRTDWGWFSYSGAFTIGGDCLYIRSNDDLWCIGAGNNQPASP